MGNKNAKQKKVDEWLKQQEAKEERLFRILLLGPGDSGKSTILKQMKKIEENLRDNGPTTEYIDSLPLIREAILIYMHILCKSNAILLSTDEVDDNIKTNVQIKETNIELRDYFAKTKITRFDTSNDNEINNENEENENKNGIPFDADDDQSIENLYKIFTTLTKSHIIPLWNDDGIKNTIRYRAMFADQIPDSAAYFLDKISEIVETDYVPTFEDYIRLRTKTSGAQIVNIEIDLDKLSDNDGKKFGIFNFEFTDIGGQAAERNKWAKVMNDQISVVLFVAAISEYDLPCYEDISKRRMSDALDAFKKLMSHNLSPKGPKFVENKQVVVLFNKYDLLFDKLKKVPLETIEEFSDFSYDEKEHEDIGEAVCEYFESHFKRVVDEVRNDNSSKTRLMFNTDKQLAFHTSQALDTQLIQQLFHKIMLHVVTGNLEKMGMGSSDSLAM